MSADTLFELDPQRFLMVPGVFAKNLMQQAFKLFARDASLCLVLTVVFHNSFRCSVVCVVAG